GSVDLDSGRKMDAESRSDRSADFSPRVASVISTSRTEVGAPNVNIILPRLEKGSSSGDILNSQIAQIKACAELFRWYVHDSFF
ncbi:MAG TPA: hypothetical protein VFW05_14320, partial [Verrucomicrobiae bacterium]|nr:hypothetical protein [Verrucomicrobiae bacterium]